MNAKWLISVIDSWVRLAALGFVWMAALAIFEVVRWSGGIVSNPLLLALILIPFPLIASHFIMRRKFIDADARWLVKTEAPVRHDPQKAKRGDDWGALLNLLDEDDAHELRQSIKRRLMDRIEDGTEEEVESFEALLSSRERQKRR